MKRRDRLQNISNFVHSNNNFQNILEETKLEIEQKFKDQLHGYFYVNDIGEFLKKDTLAYIDLDDTDTLIHATLKDIKEDKYGNKTQLVIKKSGYKRTCVISFKKNHIFRKKISNPLLDTLKKCGIDVDKILDENSN